MTKVNQEGQSKVNQEPWHTCQFPDITVDDCWEVVLVFCVCDVERIFVVLIVIGVGANVEWYFDVTVVGVGADVEWCVDVIDVGVGADVDMISGFVAVVVEVWVEVEDWVDIVIEIEGNIDVDFEDCIGEVCVFGCFVDIKVDNWSTIE